jgi:hypothetical protein
MMMGYFKSTLYYGPNNDDLSDNTSEARHERMATHPQPAIEWHHYPVITTAKCSRCGGDPTGGKLWARGPYLPLVCDKCKATN